MRTVQSLHRLSEDCLLDFTMIPQRMHGLCAKWVGECKVLQKRLQRLQKRLQKKDYRKKATKNVEI